MLASGPTCSTDFPLVGDWDETTLNGVQQDRQHDAVHPITGLNQTPDPFSSKPEENRRTKFGYTLIAGILWIAIAVGIGILGSWLTTRGGGWPILGWILAVLGWGFAGLSVVQLWRMTSMQIKGMRMMRNQPEDFERARQEFEQATGDIRDRS
jgi:hypothetical protein